MSKTSRFTEKRGSRIEDRGSGIADGKKIENEINK